MHNNFFTKHKETIIILLFSLLTFVGFSVVVLQSNIHGDAKYHTLTAKASAEKGTLMQHQPYRLFEKQGDKRIYMPIAYPLTTESLFTLFYLFGGETALKLYAPILATLIFLIMYLCIKEVGIFQAAFISLLGTLAIGERLLMTPLMEPYLIICLLLACFLLKKYYQTKNISFFFLTSLFLGTAAAIKQQGFILAMFITFFVFLFLLYQVSKKESPLLKSIGIFSLFVFILFIIPSPAFKNQIDRTGTLAYAPGGTGIITSLPFSQQIQSSLNSNLPSDPKALASIREIIGYNKQKINLVNKFKGFLLSPFLYYRSTDSGFYTSAVSMLLNLIIIIIGLGLFSHDKIIKKNRFMLILFSSLIGAEVMNSFLFRTPITQYHSFGVLIATVLLFFFTFRFNFIGKYLKTLILTLFIVFFINGYANFIYPAWGQSGREDDRQIEGYTRIGAYVKQNTAPDAIFFAAETSFRYYAQRDIVWLNESIGDTVYSISTATKDTDALKNLRLLGTDYVVINRKQIERRGVNDYLPPNGLVSFIDHSKHFTKVYDAFNDNEMVVYKINY